MYKMSAYVLCLTRAVMRNKFWSSCVTFKVITLASLMFYLGVVQHSKDKLAPFRLPSEVRCPTNLSQRPSKLFNSLKDGNIFFVETSDRVQPNFLSLCAVESAARVHPDTKVTVFMKGLFGGNGTVPRNLGLSLLGCFPNVEIRPLDLMDLFANTPLYAWYSSAWRKWEPHRLPILSDACRIAILWKYGGIYLDTDFIVLKDLKNLTNSIGTQSTYVLNGAFLAFDREHIFMERSLQNFVKNYNAWIWGHQGPQLITRVFKKWCSVRRLRDSHGCKGVSILPREAFYPIRWQDWKRYFDVITSAELDGLLGNTYAVHIWNKKSEGTEMKIGSKTMLDQLFSQKCPSTYELMQLDP
ncbi:lactosylceramide 4-alpha-galactosyltransferase [Ambystoma mexicanum]|uniref:lactosylceramide 4-alpha-galactosyltransferase n=1 Tax=Ambystoma mexicanum TaxID=8296 RepID=UPI0037E71562